MTTFTFQVRDDRHETPVTHYVIVEDAERARYRAAEHLRETVHRTAVDVYEGGHLRFSLTPDHVLPAHR